jgi:hypothetical protein
LGEGGGLDPRRGRREDGKGPVALGSDLDAAGRGEGGSQEVAVPFQERLPAGRPEFGRQPGRALDVAEEEGDRPGRQPPNRLALRVAFPSLDARSPPQ